MFVTTIELKTYYDIIKKIVDLKGKNMENLGKACSEMDFIITNLDTETSNKIPERIKNFFKNNKEKNYKVNIKVDIPLYDQPLLEETAIFIQIVFKLFIAEKSEKEKYIAESRKLFVAKNAERWLKNNS